ncbi:hypothetical protein [Halomonas sp. NO4]|uniref:hypothetical protein n=1 Tax=Halomonas sp. NO4 TaxID=2484813 RepID=UPI0013D26C4C|nr:hypothetical protein [Halomonas sp. NO4]
MKAASADEQARVAGVMERILPVSPRRAGLLNDGRSSRRCRATRWSVSTPRRCISLEDDLFGTYDVARYSVERIPDACFIGYSRGGHRWVGHHAEVMSEMADLLRAHGESR